MDELLRHALEESTRDAAHVEEDEYRLRIALALSAAESVPIATIESARCVIRALTPVMTTFVSEHCVTFAESECENDRQVFADFRAAVEVHLTDLLGDVGLGTRDLAMALTNGPLLEDEQLLRAVESFAIFHRMMFERNEALHAQARAQVGYLERHSGQAVGVHIEDAAASAPHSESVQVASPAAHIAVQTVCAGSERRVQVGALEEAEDAAAECPAVASLAKQLEQARSSFSSCSAATRALSRATSVCSPWFSSSAVATRSVMSDLIAISSACAALSCCQ